MLLFPFLNWPILFKSAIAHILNPFSELLISIGTPSKEAKAEPKTDPVIAEAKIRMCST